MESKNTFKKGMNLDVTPLDQPKDSYREANNLRIITDTAGNSVSINNIVGNELNISIPDTTEIQKITVTGSDVGETLTINGEVGAAFDTTDLTPQSLYDYLINDGSYTLLGVQYNVYYGDSYIVIVPIDPFVLTIVPAGVGLTLDSSFVPAQTGLEIIGSTTIRDDIYLFTTSNKTKNPGGHSNNSSLSIDASSVGQVWRYTYDKLTLAGTLTLIYNNYLDFSTYYAIAPTAALGRYENLGVQRIYWTDNFNKLRSLNTANPNALALDISLIDVRPSVDFDIPILTDIRNASGSVKAGSYQCAYRLKNNNGSVTNYSELSNMIFVVPNDEAVNVGGGGFKDYVGALIGTVTTKSITWTINNLDKDFDRIEVVIVSKDTPIAVPVINTIIDNPISGNNFTAVYDGTQTMTPVILADFLALSGVFTHCKTIGTKDNRLFVANIRNQFNDVNYDARAYRFPSSSLSFDLTESGATNAYNSTTWSATGVYPIVGWSTILEKSDAINSNLATQRFKRNSTILGGTGPNISYEFYTVATAADVDALGDFNVADFTPAPWRHTNPNYTTNSLTLDVKSPNNNAGSDLQRYTTQFSGGLINAGFKYSPISSLFRGYLRNESYRFGIQFYDKSKNPYFVKWIGDIQFPDYTDTNVNSFYEDGTATPISDFRLSFIDNHSGGYNEAFVQSLGIKFNVNIPAELTSFIDGYSIVRVKREEKDKTIVNNGYITRCDFGGSGDLYSPTPFVDNTMNTVTVTHDDSKGFYFTPDVSFPSGTAPTANMLMKLRGKMAITNTDPSVSFGGSQPYYFNKLYDFVPYTAPDYIIRQATSLSYAGSTTELSTGKTVHNYDFDTTGPDETVSQSIGNPCYYFFVQNGILGIDWAPAITASGKYYVAIERTLSSQYGGNTYTERSKNDYILCNHYRPIRTTIFTTSDTFEVFGGDIFLNMYDSCRAAKNWGTSGRSVSGNGTFSTTFYFPCESVVNTDLRNGTYMNKDMNIGYDIGAGAREFVENYTYNGVYSVENDVRIYIPKPDPFISNEEFDTRFHASDIKINGELVDSWSIFKPNNFWDTEGIYGPVNAMLILRDKMYFLQDRAFGTMSINPRVMITDQSNGTDLQLGTGNVLQRHDYFSTEVGCQHQWGVTKSGYKIFWLDAKNKKFYAYSPDEPITPESDVKGLFSYFVSNLKYNVLTIDKPVYQDIGVDAIGINGVRSVYDFKYNQAIFTITDSKNAGESQSLGTAFTLAFDERLDTFTSFYSFHPKIYFTDGYKIFSTDNTMDGGLSNIYMHDVGEYCKFYGTVYRSDLRLVVNDSKEDTKIFDNLLWDSQATQLDTTFNSRTNFNDDTWNSIRVFNDYQNTDEQSLILGDNIKRKERTWQVAVPRNRVLYLASNSPNIFDPSELSSPSNKSFGERIRDKYIMIDLAYFNTNNNLLATNNITTLFRISAR